jgi:hypothetical protein
MTVRQVFYQAVVHGIVGKAETEYDKVEDLLTDLRRDGEIHADADPEKFELAGADRCPAPPIHLVAGGDNS